MRWRHIEADPRQVALLRQTLGVSPVVARLLARAGHDEVATAQSFLHPRLKHLADPFLIPQMGDAVERIRAALRCEERIRIVGDYDVDGVTSTVLLVSILQYYGGNPDFLVPRRLDEGYGLSEACVERLLEPPLPSLIIALDCGTNSVAEVARIRKQGIEVIVVDHHRSKDAVPADCILVNPHLNEAISSTSSRLLCTVGLVFKLVHGLTKKLREAGDPRAEAIRLRDFLDLVALGTIADLVPLKEENRIFVRYGLRQLQSGERPGVASLCEVSGVDPSAHLSTMDVAFRLAPRINASGRLADASLPVEMLLGRHYGECLRAARELDDFNRERQGIERRMFREAEQFVAESRRDYFGVVVHGADWHPGVVGIVAGKLAKKLHRPCIALGRDGDLFKGSGRSVAGIDLQQILPACDELLLQWGGHPMAVGVTLDKDAVGDFRNEFDQSVRRLLSGEAFPEPVLDIAAWLEPGDFGSALLNELDLLQPFGEGHREPVFGLRGLTLSDPPRTFGEAHLRFLLPGNDGSISGVGWRMAHRPPPVGQPIDLAVRLNWNFFRGQNRPQAELVDWRCA